MSRLRNISWRHSLTMACRRAIASAVKPILSKYSRAPTLKRKSPVISPTLVIMPAEGGLAALPRVKAAILLLPLHFRKYNYGHFKPFCANGQD